MHLPSSILVIVAVVALCLVHVEPIKCNVGYGQRGKLRNYGYDWVMRIHFVLPLICYSRESAQTPNIAGRP